MPEYLSPGVYVEEFDSGPVPMQGVSTSTAGFLGLAERGPVEGLPVLITGMADFQRNFGGYLSENAFGVYRYLAYAVEHFFGNGGSRCYVMRVAPPGALPAANVELDKVDDKKPGLRIIARNPGQWGNRITVTLRPTSKAKTQVSEVLDGGKYRVKSSSGFRAGDVIAYTDASEADKEPTSSYHRVVSALDNVLEIAPPLDGSVEDTNLVPVKTLTTREFNLEVNYGSEAEVFENASLNAAAPNYIGIVASRSALVQVNWHEGEPDAAAADSVLSPFEVISGAAESTGRYQLTLSGGSDGSVDSITPDAFMGADFGPGKRTGIKAFIDNDEVSLMAVPGITDPNVQLALTGHCENATNRFAILDAPRDSTKVPDIKAHRNYFDTSYAALYSPWLLVFDPFEKRSVAIPPSGSMAGIYARSDNTRGVHKAPANEVVRGVTGLYCQYNTGEQDILNPLGINLIRQFTGQGIRVWGARTCSSNGLWKYINVRRLFIFVEESIRRNTNWVVFEPNDAPLWARVQRTIDSFLTTVWRDGALQGASPGEAFYVDIGPNTMTQDDIDNGRLICVIGIAAVKPAEFVIFRITQKTATE
ncbi:phage tail sheath family protein [Paenibacillus campi]|uniref:phage tail sheath family protein n=1 Tax=Paenibacillus campi TaxID=3106031 RepID=UPI002AFFD4C3|nr:MULTISPECIES: phage tail sheath subtilisin-like domain-containing protein [unclassified Paenibacillus]